MDCFSKFRALKFSLPANKYIDIFETSKFALESMLRIVSVSDATEDIQLPCAVTGMTKFIGCYAI